MNNYLACVELHGAKEEDYQVLHQQMENLGFVRKINQEDGSLSHLPSGTYISSGDAELNVIQAHISARADQICGVPASVFVCKLDACSWALRRADSEASSELPVSASDEV